ncbi:DUF1826 domain-containing protein [Pseudomonas anguilliseptica]|uniref:DUF1826 domain-containing protein n=1 Tax=Pseudomonas anguilliseptica TaxID=53406 RepID=UPI001F1E008F|nr:DUF1826 domain-containing protein [Pseudomonas anguilliseptica]MCE5361633.1 DUF1826 domain-containing protein [Pseudomonas anguilliseptica]
MLAQVLRQPLQQVSSEQIDVFGEVLRDEVNLALWQRQLPPQISDFANALLAQGEPLSQSMVLELANPESEANLSGLVDGYSDLPGQAAFLQDVSWLVSAFACLFDAKRIGLRLRILDKAMCPRFHVDHVPVRLISSYAGVGSEWLAEGVMARRRLGDPAAEPSDSSLIQRAEAGHVLLAKGEKWTGNEGGGLIHRSPQPPDGERRLLLTLDWLA